MSENDSEPEHLNEWLASTNETLEEGRRAGWNDFVDNYESVLRAALEQIPTMGQRLSSILEGAGNLQPHQFLQRYVDAMSVEMDGERIFLPSFSDQCLWEVVKGSSHILALSPLRGLYYSWKISEIAAAFQGGSRSVALAYRKLERLLDDRLAADYSAQAPSSAYSRYESALRNDAQASRWDDHIQSTKKAIRTIAAPLKWRWIHIYPYPCITSSHFYLSGVRFYHNAHLHGSNDLGSDARYCVQSTDSGLVAATERYGMLMPATSGPDVALELLAEVPPGSLMLDLSTAEPTPEDRANLRYFENWSRLITARIYAIVTETLSMRGYTARSKKAHRPNMYERLGRGYFLDALTKNPMRTFYFDTGIYGAARLAIRSGLPKIQYVTTRRTKVPRGKVGEPGRNMLDHLFAEYSDGIEFYVADDQTWPTPEMAAWTLLPIGEKLPGRTSCLWSIRSADSRKISHGIEGMRRDAYLRGAVSPSELALETLEAMIGGALGGTIVPGQIITGILLGGLLGSGFNITKIRRSTHRTIDAVTNIRNSDRYSCLHETSQFPD